MNAALLVLFAYGCGAQPEAASTPTPSQAPQEEHWVPSRVPPPDEIRKPDQAPRVVRGAEEPQAADPAAAAVLAGVRAIKGRFETCVGQSLKQEPPSSPGRITASWTVTGGVVSGVHLLENTTGSEELGRCFERGLRSLRLPESISGTVDSYVWTITDPGEPITR